MRRAVRPGGGALRTAPVTSATRSKSFSRCKTLSPASAAAAAMIRSGIEGTRCWPRSASIALVCHRRSSIDGVRYSTGMADGGGCRNPARKSGPERAEDPASRLVTAVIRTSPRSIAAPLRRVWADPERASAPGFAGYRAIGQLLILAARSSGRLPAARAFAPDRRWRRLSCAGGHFAWLTTNACWRRELST